MFRKLHDSQLVRRTSPFCSISFSALHGLDASSPLYGQTEESLREMGLEIIVLLSGVDETSGQTVHARTSYAAEELCFGQRFREIILIEPDENRMIDYRIFHKTQPSPLPPEHLPSFAVTSGPVAAST